MEREFWILLIADVIGRLIGALFTAFIIMLVWNFVVVKLIEINSISFLMAFGITIVLSIIGSFFKSSN